MPSYNNIVGAFWQPLPSDNDSLIHEGNRVGRRRSVSDVANVGLSTPHISPLSVPTPIVIENSSVVSAPRQVFTLDTERVIDTAGVDVAPVYIARTEGKIEIWDGGGLVRAKIPPRHKLGVGSDRGGGRRGRVRGFSKGSRRRLQQTIGKVRNEVIPLFVGLTYPADFPHESSTWKRHLDNLFKRMARRWPASSAVWRLEPQKRMAPHFHMLVWGIDRNELICWIGRAWYEVVGSGDEKHLRAGSRVEEIRSWRGVRSYTSKYLAKAQPVDKAGNPINPGDWDFPGRWWGIFNRGELPFADCVTLAMPRAESIILLRTMRRYARLRSRDYSSLSILVNNASFWLARLDDILRC